MRPPRFAIRLVSWRLGAAEAEFVLGDLEEGFYARCRDEGLSRARVWYWRQTVRVFMPDRSALPPSPAPAAGVLMAALLRNLKLAWRLAVRQPLFSLTIVVTLGLAIGANAVIFSMVDALMLRPVPVAEPERVAWIFGVDGRSRIDRADISPADYLDFATVGVFVNLAAIKPSAYTLTGRGDARRLSAYQITPNLFDVWGMRVAHGRRFHQADASPVAPPVAILTEGFWKREFGGDPAAVGQILMLSGAAHTIVGVFGPELNYGDIVDTQVWTPYAPDRATADRADRSLTVMGILARGATIQQADAEVKAIAERLRADHPATHGAWSAQALSFRRAITNEETWLILGLLSIAVAMVMLIAAANVANMLLARMAGRRRELAVRTALGAGRAQIAAQIVSESLVLALAGGVLGLGFAHASLKALVLLGGGNYFVEALQVNYRVAAFAMALALFAPLLFALLPALQAARAGVAQGLNDSGARTTGGRRAQRVRGALVVAQIALATTLLVVSTLSLRSMIALMSFDVGFAGHRVVAARFEAPSWKYTTPDEVRVFVERAVGDVRAVAGVSTAAATASVPALDRDVLVRLDIEGQPLEREESRVAGRTIAGIDYFEALGIPVLHGRPFDARDGSDARPVAIVSRTAAERYFGGAPGAIDRRIRLAEPDSWASIVGVVDDVANPDVDQPPNPIVYLPFAQHPERSVVILAVSDAPAVVTAPIRDAMRALDRDVAVDVSTFGALLRREFSGTRVIVALFIAFGALALALAASGLYGVIAFVVAQRTREIGVRFALGAQPADVRRLMIRQGGVLIGIGLALGLAASVALAQITRSILFGVSVSDPTTYAGIAAVVGLTA
ncbi:MAG TPA: ADOP family duplicated permease, partial [Vicinamibacterales bacterium]|nr:ADOP family duplicated permease [Vicinamibacterales bacterium]